MLRAFVLKEVKMRYSYKTQGVCSYEISFDIEGDIISKIEFTGGCSGNLKAISKLLEGAKADHIISTLEGNTCGFKNTSCADQLARAVKKALGR